MLEAQFSLITRLSGLMHPTVGENFCSVRTDTRLKIKKLKHFFDLSLKSIVSVKNTETVDCELFIMLEGAFCVALFVWYEATLYAYCPSGTLMKRRYFISLPMPVNEFCKVNTIYKAKPSSKDISVLPFGYRGSYSCLSEGQIWYAIIKSQAIW